MVGDSDAVVGCRTILINSLLKPLPRASTSCPRFKTNGATGPIGSSLLAKYLR